MKIYKTKVSKITNFEINIIAKTEQEAMEKLENMIEKSTILDTKEGEYEIDIEEIDDLDSIEFEDNECENCEFYCPYCDRCMIEEE